MKTIWMPALRNELGQINAPLTHPEDQTTIEAATAAAHAQAQQQLTQMKQNAEAMQQQQMQQAQTQTQQAIEEGSKYVVPIVVGGLALTGLTIWGVYKIVHG